MRVVLSRWSIIEPVEVDMVAVEGFGRRLMRD
jgi:hypothetical protein